MRIFVIQQTGYDDSQVRLSFLFILQQRSQSWFYWFRRSKWRHLWITLPASVYTHVRTAGNINPTVYIYEYWMYCTVLAFMCNEWLRDTQDITRRRLHDAHGPALVSTPRPSAPSLLAFGAQLTLAVCTWCPCSLYPNLPLIFYFFPSV